MQPANSSTERTPLLPRPQWAAPSRLCVSHFLSAWNSRLFEFGSVLFLTAIYPGTLMPVSVYALVRAAAAIALSPALGLWIDGADRLVVVVELTEGDNLARQNLNAQIRRIDLICKLLSPFVIASIDEVSTVVAIWTTMAMTVLSVFAEYICIEQVTSELSLATASSLK
ncbi:hypothetical protein QQX98_004306 [Neonectria punicea]|uniref:Solute carrier family 40 member n=1 Tax=Neonectria punicea TaxID=979145 RepID=A0ABR1HA78_9HYPO